MSDTITCQRIGRARYWGQTSLCLVVFVVAYFSFILAIVATNKGWTNYVDLAAVVVAIFLFGTASFAMLTIGVRRLRHRGKSGLWIVIYYIVPALMVALALDPDDRNAVLNVIAAAILLWAVVDLGVLKGEAVPQSA